MEVQIPELKILLEEIKKVKQEISALKPLSPEPYWYDLKTACQVKGIKYRTALSCPRYQPNNGIPDGILTGRKRWTKYTIAKWKLSTDDSNNPNIREEK